MIRRYLVLLVAIFAAPVEAGQIFAQYPPSALKQREQGTAAVAISIAPSGKPESCIVTRSSGSVALDKATCVVALKSSFQSQEEQTRRLRTRIIRWLIPEAAQSSDPSFLAVADFVIAQPDFTHLPRISGMSQPALDPVAPDAENITPLVMLSVEADGKLDRCSTIRTSGLSDLDLEACNLVLHNRLYSPARDSKENAVPSWVGIPWTFQVSSAKSSSINPAARERLPGSFAAAQAIRGEFWFTGDDYPATAIRAAEQGDAVVDVDVSTAGRATACRVIASSGFQDLDEQSCRLILRRGRFLPAHDIDGTLIVSTYRRNMDWRLPEASPPPSRIEQVSSNISLAKIPMGLMSAFFDLRYLVDEKGHIERCEPETSSGITKLDELACRMTIASLQFQQIVGASGKAARSVRTSRVFLNLSS